MRAAMLVVMLTGCGYDWTVIPKSDASAPSDASTTTICASDTQCPQDWFCVFPDHLCGKGTTGTCRQVPPTTSCEDAGIQRACGCDGTVLKTLCQANAFGVDLSLNVKCKPPTDGTACGYLFCDKGVACTKETVDGGTSFRCGP